VEDWCCLLGRGDVNNMCTVYYNKSKNTNNNNSGMNYCEKVCDVELCELAEAFLFPFDVFFLVQHDQIKNSITKSDSNAFSFFCISF